MKSQSCIALLLLFCIPVSLSAPKFDAVVEGTASVTTDGTNTIINQSSHSTIINWHSFDVDKQEHVNFSQPSVSSIAINNILNQNPSRIIGNITANGRVVLLNPNGFYIGANSTISANTFIAAAANLQNVTYNQTANHLRITDSHLVTGDITVHGTITANTTQLVARTISLPQTSSIDATQTNITAYRSIRLHAAISSNTIDIFANESIIGAGILTSENTDLTTNYLSLSGDYQANNDINITAHTILLNASVNVIANQTNIIAGNSTLISATIQSNTININAHNSITLLSANLNANSLTNAGTITIGSFTNPPHSITSYGATIIQANSTDHGNAGSIIFYGTNTNIQGTVSATAEVGNGGFIELSAINRLDIKENLTIQLQSQQGRAGTLLIDPDFIVITNNPLALMGATSLDITVDLFRVALEALFSTSDAALPPPPPASLEYYPSSTARFGNSVALTDSFALIGIPGIAGGVGSAYLFDIENETWVDLATTPGSPVVGFTTGDSIGIGSAVALNDDFALLGAPGVDNRRGDAYLYRIDGSNVFNASCGSGTPVSAWCVLSAAAGSPIGTADLVTGANIGSAVALNDDFALLGAPGVESGRGDAVLYRIDGSNVFNASCGSGTPVSAWCVLSAAAGSPIGTADLVTGANIGSAVALNDDFALLGAPGVESGRGDAVLYRIDGSDTFSSTCIYSAGTTPWCLLSTASDTTHMMSDLRYNSPVDGLTNGASFGSAVALDSNYAVIGAPSIGEAYLFNVDQTTDRVFGAGCDLTVAFTTPWCTLSTSENFPTLGISSGFGSAVALNDDFVAIGAPGDVEVYLFQFDVSRTNIAASCVGRRWCLISEVDTESDFAGTQNPIRDVGLTARANFGSTVSLNGSRLLVGSPNATSANNSEGGSAYQFLLTVPSQLNLTPDDVQAMLQLGNVILRANFDISVDASVNYFGNNTLSLLSSGTINARSTFDLNPNLPFLNVKNLVITASGAIGTSTHPLAIFGISNNLIPSSGITVQSSLNIVNFYTYPTNIVRQLVLIDSGMGTPCSSVSLHPSLDTCPGVDDPNNFLNDLNNLSVTYGLDVAYIEVSLLAALSVSELTLAAQYGITYIETTPGTSVLNATGLTLNFLTTQNTPFTTDTCSRCLLNGINLSDLSLEGVVVNANSDFAVELRSSSDLNIGSINSRRVVLTAGSTTPFSPGSILPNCAAALYTCGVNSTFNGSVTINAATDIGTVDNHLMISSGQNENLFSFVGLNAGNDVYVGRRINALELIKPSNNDRPRIVFTSVDAMGNPTGNHIFSLLQTENNITPNEVFDIDSRLFCGIGRVCADDAVGVVLTAGASYFSSLSPVGGISGVINITAGTISLVANGRIEVRGLLRSIATPDPDMTPDATDTDCMLEGVIAQICLLSSSLEIGTAITPVNVRLDNGGGIAVSSATNTSITSSLSYRVVAARSLATSDGNLRFGISADESLFFAGTTDLYNSTNDYEFISTATDARLIIANPDWATLAYATDSITINFENIDFLESNQSFSLNSANITFTNRLVFNGSLEVNTGSFIVDGGSTGQIEGSFDAMIMPTSLIDFLDATEISISAATIGTAAIPATPTDSRVPELPLVIAISNNTPLSGTVTGERLFIFVDSNVTLGAIDAIGPNPARIAISANGSISLVATQNVGTVLDHWFLQANSGSITTSVNGRLVSANSIVLHASNAISFGDAFLDIENSGSRIIPDFLENRNDLLQLEVLAPGESFAGLLWGASVGTSANRLQIQMRDSASLIKVLSDSDIYLHGVRDLRVAELVSNATEAGTIDATADGSITVAQSLSSIVVPNAVIDAISLVAVDDLIIDGEINGSSVTLSGSTIIANNSGLIRSAIISLIATAGGVASSQIPLTVSSGFNENPDFTRFDISVPVGESIYLMRNVIAAADWFRRIDIFGNAILSVNGTNYIYGFYDDVVLVAGGVCPTLRASIDVCPNDLTPLRTFTLVDATPTSIRTTIYLRESIIERSSGDVEIFAAQNIRVSGTFTEGLRLPLSQSLSIVTSGPGNQVSNRGVAIDLGSLPITLTNNGLIEILSNTGDIVSLDVLSSNYITARAVVGNILLNELRTGSSLASCNNPNSCGSIQLIADAGSIGSNQSPVRIFQSFDTRALNARAASGDIYLLGLNTLHLGEISTSNTAMITSRISITTLQPINITGDLLLISDHGIMVNNSIMANRIVFNAVNTIDVNSSLSFSHLSLTTFALNDADSGRPIRLFNISGGSIFADNETTSLELSLNSANPGHFEVATGHDILINQFVLSPGTTVLVRTPDEPYLTRTVLLPVRQDTILGDVVNGLFGAFGVDDGCESLFGSGDFCFTE